MKESTEKQQQQKITEIYNQNKKNKKYNRHQHSTDGGWQAIGEELRHVQMSRWGKHAGEGYGNEQQ